MWAWRSILRRSHPLLSRLRPARRHASQIAPILGSNNRMGTGSLGYASNSNGEVNRQHHQAVVEATKCHLYLVLDDHKDGFGIHKLDVGDNDDHDQDCATRRLPDPPVFRLPLTAMGRHVQFAAVGSSIVATGKYRFMQAVLIYDTKTGALTASAHLPFDLVGCYKAAMAVGSSLYMLSTEPPRLPWRLNDYSDCDGGSLYCLTTDPLDPADSEGHKFWGWHLVCESSSWLWSHFKSPPKLPFWAKHITAHAAHASPPGAAEQHELFVSIRPTKTSVLGATYSFSTASRKWRRRGEWQLPVVGRAHYDGQLDAWVGLHAVNIDGNMYGPRVTDGHLCAGNVTSAPTKWNIGKEKLFRLDEDDVAGWRHVDAKLVQIVAEEGGNEYCLMERLYPKEEVQKDEEDERNCWGDGRKGLLRLTSFRVERGQGGEPLVTARRMVHSYEVSSHSRHFDAQVFFI